MSTRDLLNIHPSELKFPFELKKQSSCSLQLTNKTDDYVAFKVKTTNPKKYCSRPNTGVVWPRTTCDVTVTMQAQKETLADMQCKEKFLLQSVIVPNGTTTKDITAEMLNKESGHVVEEFKLRVAYIPANPPSPVPEESEEGTSPRVSVGNNGNQNASLFDAVSKSFEVSKEKSSESNGRYFTVKTILAAKEATESQNGSQQSSSQRDGDSKGSVSCSSFDLQAFTPVRNLSPRLSRCKIGVSVTRVWEVNTANTSTWEFILIDSEGDQIHGKVCKSMYGSFSDLLTEGSALAIEDFHVIEKPIPSYCPLPQRRYVEITENTHITPLDGNIIFPNQRFHLIPFGDLRGRLNKIDYLSDVMGVFFKLTEYARKKELTIFNERGETVNIMFWDGTVSENPTVFEMMKDKIVVVTTTAVRERDGILYLIGTKGSKIYFEPDISEKGSVISKKRIMDISSLQTIDYIQYMVSKESTESYTCKARIIQVYHNQGWSYLSCVQCKKKLKPKQAKSLHWCDKCNKYVSQSVLKILIQFRVKDNTGQQDLTAFEEVATELVGKTRDEFIALDRTGGGAAVEAMLDEIVGNEYYFRIKINNFNISHQGRSLTTISATQTDSSNKRLKICK